MLSVFRRMMKDHRGAMALEYTLIVSLIAVAAMAARDWLSVNPAALAEMTPYAQIAIAAVSILVQQFTHAARRSGVTNG